MSEHVNLVDVTTPINLEDTSMVKEWAERFSNMIVEASSMAKEVAKLREELEVFKNQVAVANEAAARAIEERNAAITERDEAKRAKAIAQDAWNEVNEKRIEAERALHEAQQERDEAKAYVENHRGKLSDAETEAQLYKDENEKLKAGHEEHVSRLTADKDVAVASKDAELQALRLQIAAERELKDRALSELDVSTRDCGQLRKIISETKLALDEVRGVLAGELAAE